MLTFLVFATTILALSSAAPTPDEIKPPPLISFDNGNVGVNFLGFKASAGLGGLLTGNVADGGLHAEAETPYGQKAGAGLGGTVDANGRNAGALYAGATAGHGVEAGAGLAGNVGANGAIGGSYAGASNGVSSSQVINYKTAVHSAPAYQKNIEIIKSQPQTAYIEKTFQVPTYVEKTFEVAPAPIPVAPVPVPVAPVVYEKSKTKVVNVVDTRFAEGPSTIKVVHKVKRPHHRHHIRKYFTFGHLGSQVATAPQPIQPIAYPQPQNIGYTSTYTKNVQANSQFFNDIFNIPISTLAAVNRLVGGIADSKNGQVSVTKQVHYS